MLIVKLILEDLMFGLRSRSAVRTLTPAEVRDLLAKDAITLVDVREDNEWAQGHIAGAIHRPLSRLRETAPALPQGKPVVFHCAVGGRSAQAVALCQSLGLPHDTHMAGGLSGWTAQDLPLTR
jgi:rhodanese-related sulfurtransferase